MTRTTEPTEITQGEFVAWTKSFANYSAADYDLQYRFRGPGTGIDVDADADGSGWDVELAAESPAFNVVGTYQWQAWLTEIATPANTFTILSGSIKVLQGFVAESTEDIEVRSPARIMLDSINAALLAFSTSDVQEYEIASPAGSRRVKRSDKVQLMSMRREWATIVTNETARERAKNGRPLMQSIKMRVHDE